MPQWLMPVSVAVFAHGHRFVRVVVMPFVMAMGVSATEPMAARQAIAATCQNPTCTEMAHQVRCRRQVPAYAADGRLGGDEFGAANVAPGSAAASRSRKVSDSLEPGAASQTVSRQIRCQRPDPFVSRRSDLPGQRQPPTYTCLMTFSTAMAAYR